MVKHFNDPEAAVIFTLFADCTIWEDFEIVAWEWMHDWMKNPPAWQTKSEFEWDLQQLTDIRSDKFADLEVADSLFDS